MATTPWAVTSHKRKRPPSAMRPKKHAKTRDQSASFNPMRQQTLTQAQWILSRPPNFSDNDLIPIQPEDEAPKSKVRQKPVKRDVSLTQMDFFPGRLPFANSDADLVEILEDMSPDYAPLPQLDGINDSPRKPKQKRSSAPGPATGSTKESAYSQEYRPSKKRKSQEVLVRPDGVLRRSSRMTEAQQALAHQAVLADPAANYDYFEQNLSPPHHPPQLEIKDSTASNEDENDPPTMRPAVQRDELPRTPVKRRGVVLSSQSPDDLLSSRKRAPLSPVPVNQGKAMTPAHSPLQPRSVQGLSKPAAPKTGSLKRPSKAPKLRVENSQADVYHSPHSSSPQKQRMRPQESSQTCHRQDSAKVEAAAIDNQPDILSRHQAEEQKSGPPGAESPGSLRSLSQLMQRGKYNHASNTAALAAVDTEERTVATVEARDFATSLDVAKSQQEPSSRPGNGPGAPKPPIIADVDEADDVFGSPIANDTQFNADLQHRTSSAVASQRQVSQELPAGDIPTEPLPTPRLVKARDSHASERDPQDPVESNLPEVPTPATNIYTQTTRVPLNDLHPSSPTERSSTKSVTSRSIHPASMPHPSQISTQEATQGGLGMLSSIAPAETETPRGRQQITIKDSSSIHRALSQIPPHEQSPLNGHLGLDEIIEGDEEDYDLDPPSSQSEPQLPTRQITEKSDEKDPDASPTSELTEPLRTRGDHVETASGRRIAAKEPEADAAPEEVDYPSSQPRSSPAPRSSPVRLEKSLSQYTQLPGYNNETQSKFTQGGHVTAAYVHSLREQNMIPRTHTPKPFKVPGYTGRR